MMFKIIISIVLVALLSVGIVSAKDSRFIVTAYCPCEICCGEYSDGITASGHVIQPNDKFCAAPPEIEFGTMISIPGYGMVPVLDRGSAIIGNRLDLFFPTHDEARAWGVQILSIKIMGVEK